jgi:hypothetical protein
VVSFMGLIILPGIPVGSEEGAEKLVISSSKCDWLSIGGSRGGVVSSRLRASIVRPGVMPLADCSALRVEVGKLVSETTITSTGNSGSTNQPCTEQCKTFT